MQSEINEPKVDSLAIGSTTFSILIVDDEVATRNVCRDVAVEAGLQVHVASTTEEALEILDQLPVDIVVTDLQVPQLGGLELLKRTRANNAEIAVMVLTQYGTIATAIEATRLGATDFVTKPFHIEELRAKLDRLIHTIEVDQENRLMREELRSRPGFGGLIGMSPRMQRVYKLIQKVAQHTYPVLILGESGTGKELVARPIHTVSEDAMRRIMSYDWPGNIRELENAIERAVALGSGPILHVGDLPSNLQYTSVEKHSNGDELVPLDILERRAIFRALQETSGDKLAAARLLGIGKTTLYRKLKQYESRRAIA
jgi:DNA-binding NtrC family response regulator